MASQNLGHNVADKRVSSTSAGFRDLQVQLFWGIVVTVKLFQVNMRWPDFLFIIIVKTVCVYKYLGIGGSKSTMAVACNQSEPQRHPGFHIMTVGAQPLIRVARSKFVYCTLVFREEYPSAS